MTPCVLNYVLSLTLYQPFFQSIFETTLDRLQLSTYLQTRRSKNFLNINLIVKSTFLVKEYMCVQVEVKKVNY